MWWTTEQVAEHAGMTVEQVWETRRRKEWPGVAGVRQGRRLRFDPEVVKAGPREAEHTDDAATAAVWLLEDIRNLVGQIHQAITDIRRWQQEQQRFEAVLSETVTTIAEFADDEERADDDGDE